MQNANNAGSEAPIAPASSVWMRVLLVLLAAEKVVQHIAVTLAFIFNVGEIRASVALDFRFFLVVGAIEAVLFALGGWGILRVTSWATRLLLVLALVDIIGEFVAQGTVLITINVSILVAIILLGVSLAYRSPQR